MTKDKKCVVAATGILAILAVMGLVVAGRVAPPMCGDSLWFMKRQTICLSLGVLAGALAACIPWRRWLLMSYVLFALWLVAFVMSAAFSPVNGFCQYLSLGPIRIDTWTLAWPIVGLVLAAVRTKVNLRSRWLLAMVVAAVWGCMAMKVLTNENRLLCAKALLGMVEMSSVENLPAGPHVAEQEALCEVWQKSRWIGCCGEAMGEAVPYAHTSGVTSGMAAAFGKVFPLSAVVLFGVMLALLGFVAKRMKDSAGRLFLFMYGLWLCIPAYYNLGVCTKTIPCLSMGVPFVSFGMTAVVAACVGLGIVWSLVREKDTLSKAKTGVAGAGDFELI